MNSRAYPEGEYKNRIASSHKEENAYTNKDYYCTNHSPSTRLSIAARLDLISVFDLLNSDDVMLVLFALLFCPRHNPVRKIDNRILDVIVFPGLSESYDGMPNLEDIN